MDMSSEASSPRNKTCLKKLWPYQKIHCAAAKMYTSSNIALFSL